MNNKRIIKRWLVLVILTIPLLSACTNQEVEHEEERTLTIGILEDQSEVSYRQMYSNLFALANSNINIEYVIAKPDPNNVFMRSSDFDSFEVMKSLMEEAQPDVVALRYGDYLKLEKENLLIALDPFMKDSGMSDEDFIPSAIEALRMTSDQGIYGIHPYFQSYALIYNKEIFSAAGIDPPVDGMTWDEIFDLAELVTVQDDGRPIYGFSFNAMQDFQLNLNNLIQFPSPMNQLPIYEDRKMRVNHDEWRTVFAKMKQLVDNGVIPFKRSAETINSVSDAHFLSGKLAMGLIPFGEIRDLLQLTENPSLMEGYDPIDWDLVTAPSNEDTPFESSAVNYGPIFAINTKAQNREDAWEFISFINGEEWMNLKGMSQSTRKNSSNYLNHDINIEAFNKLRPIANDSFILSQTNYLPSNVAMPPGHMTFDRFINGALSLDEAIEYWETEGNLALQKE